ncbi:MAG TPA: VWA domain-containing protein [Bryobacteraceae bacterium]|nr:VWA domain-containing protein [Bryobacteraceae bacterium]
MRLLWLVPAVTGVCLLAQQDTTFSTDVNVVNIFATVHDKKDKPVSNLAKDDFTLSEDGHQQTIRYFSRESDLPLTLGLLVDTSQSQAGVLEDEKDASDRFLDQVLRPDKDRTFVIHFDHETELLQDLTSSLPDLHKSIDQMHLADDARPQMRRQGGGPNSDPTQGRQGRIAGTVLYDAIFLASDELMKPLKGRKALILLTDGVDNGSKESLYSAIQSAQRSGVIVYSIYFTDRPAESNRVGSVFGPMGGMGGMGRRGGMGRPGGGGGRYPGAQSRTDGKKILEQISRETGGGFFEVTKKESISDIYTRIQDELRNQYSIGYVSDQAANGASFRHIVLTAKKSGLTVQAPEGYYPVPAPPAPSEPPHR